MIQLILLLLGAQFAKGRLRTIALIGILWGAIGIFLMVDALDGVLWFPLRIFGFFLFAEGICTLLLAKSGMSLQTRFRYTKGALFVVIALLVMVKHHYGDFILAMLFGCAFAMEGLLQIGAAWLVRYPQWRWTVAMGATNLVFSVIIFQPYPTHYAGTVPYCLGLWMLMTGGRMVLLYFRLMRIPTAELLARTRLANMPDLAPGADAYAHSEDSKPMTVHVWTPTGSSKGPPVHRPVIDRYIAAVDVNGVISTGHAALEAGPDTYISLYPAVEIDRSPDEFTRLLRADASNDIPGRYLPDYPHEAASWCESTAKISFRRYNGARLREFWQRYRATEIYNLTSRNCSSTVALAIEAALEGSADTKGKGGWKNVVRLLVTPELWIAAQLRHRAHTMAWTPGLVLDYARALRIVVHPPPIGWLSLARLALRKMSRVRRHGKPQHQAHHHTQHQAHHQTQHQTHHQANEHGDEHGDEHEYRAPAHDPRNQ